MATFGQIFATKCASRKLHRDLLDILKIKEPPVDKVKNPKAKAPWYRDIMGGFEDSDEEEREKILEDKLDLPLILNRLDSLYEKVMAGNE